MNILSLIPAIFLVTSMHASLIDEIAFFKSQILSAVPVINSAAQAFKTDYKANGANVPITTITFGTSNVDDFANPIYTIKYGLVTSKNVANCSGSCDSTLFDTAGVNDRGLYILEVKFKTGTQKKDISPALDGRFATFFALGNQSDLISFNSSGSSFNGVRAGTTTPDTTMLSQAPSMKSIKSFLCKLKTLTRLQLEARHIHMRIYHFYSNH